jgi:hypothetical protein
MGCDSWGLVGRWGDSYPPTSPSSISSRREDVKSHTRIVFPSVLPVPSKLQLVYLHRIEVVTSRKSSGATVKKSYHSDRL